jgi:molybdenum cofactor guanylyltransferase
MSAVDSLPAVTGLILAGGRGSRMGGVDKGLQPYKGKPLALNALQRLQAQDMPLARVMVNANRNTAIYQGWGVPVCPDTLEGYAGPLAGFLTGLTLCATPWLLTVPCDSPRFPLQLLSRLYSAVRREGADIAMANALEEDGQWHAQPVFCLMRSTLRESLHAFTSHGGRKIDAWTGLHHTVMVPFDAPGDDPMAFFNANTLAQLQQLDSHA